jgi:hypothetical protein
MAKKIPEFVGTVNVGDVMAKNPGRWRSGAMRPIVRRTVTAISPGANGYPPGRWFQVDNKNVQNLKRSYLPKKR